MPTEKETRRDPALDGLRGVAVLMVFLYHYGGGLSSRHILVHLFGLATAAGWSGIVIFFTLSGFLITGSLWDAWGGRGSVFNFYVRRMLRIFPLYYAVLLVVVLASLMRGSNFEELQPFTILLFFLQDIPGLATQALRTPSPLPLYHLWTLAVEEQFYVLWPLLIWISSRATQVSPLRRAIDLSLSLFVLSALFRAAVYGMFFSGNMVLAGLFDNFLLTHLGALALGAALALALRHPEISHRVYPWAGAAFAAGIAAYMASSALGDSPLLRAPVQYIVGLPALSVASAGLITLAQRQGPLRRSLAFAPLRWIGRISYGVYIFHILLQPVFDAIALRLTHTAAGTAYHVLRFVFGLPITLAISAVSYYFLEAPFLYLKRRFPLHPRTL